MIVAIVPQSSRLLFSNYFVSFSSIIIIITFHIFFVICSYLTAAFIIFNFRKLIMFSCQMSLQFIFKSANKVAQFTFKSFNGFNNSFSTYYTRNFLVSFADTLSAAFLTTTAKPSILSILPGCDVPTWQPHATISVAGEKKHDRTDQVVPDSVRWRTQAWVVHRAKPGGWTDHDDQSSQEWTPAHRRPQECWCFTEIDIEVNPGKTTTNSKSGCPFNRQQQIPKEKSSVLLFGE